MKYMFDPCDTLQNMLAQCSERRYASIKEAFAASFSEKCALLDNGCLVYLGGHTVRIPQHLTDITFTTPRRAAYLICNEVLPGHDLKPICGTPECILPAHLAAGRRRRPRTGLTMALMKSVLSETGQSIRYLSRKYGLDRRTVKRIFELNQADPYWYERDESE